MNCHGRNQTTSLVPFSYKFSTNTSVIRYIFSMQFSIIIYLQTALVPLRLVPMLNKDRIQQMNWDKQHMNELKYAHRI